MVENKENSEKPKNTRKFKASMTGSMVTAEDKAGARGLYEQGVYGEPKEGKMQYSFVETLYLLERGKLDVYKDKKKIKKERNKVI